MNRDQKAAVVEQIAADISAAEAIFAIDYRGITVAQADALRGRLRDANANFRAVKNSLTERAAGTLRVRKNRAAAAPRGPGRRGGPKAAARSPDGADVRARRRRCGGQGD